MGTHRIASLLASGTEIICALGLEESLVAISHECDYPSRILNRPRVTSTTINDQAPSRDIDDAVRTHSKQRISLYKIDEQLLAAARPDLIVTQAHCDVCAVSDHDVSAAVCRTPALGAAQVVSLGAATLEGVFDDIRAVGAAAGAPESADAVIAELRARMHRVRSAVETVPAKARPRVACIEWIDPVMIAANWMPELIELAGGVSGLTQPGATSAYTDWRDVCRYDPDVIVVMPCGFDLRRTLAEWAALARMPGWQGLSAVRRGRVYAADGNAYFNRTGPRMIDSLELLAHLIHPDRVPLRRTDITDRWRRLE